MTEHGRQRTQQIERLQLRIQQVLAEHPEGISEFDLLKQLEQQGDDLPTRRMADSLSLFQSHFLLFHALYRLRDVLHAGQRHGITIDCLNIRLTPYGETDTVLPTTHDPLREYYLDLANLDETGEAEVEALLTQFWLRYAANDARAEALAVLELQDPVEPAEIKLRYRQLAMQHHPDRGGDKEQLQAINAAMAVLVKV